MKRRPSRQRFGVGSALVTLLLVSSCTNSSQSNNGDKTPMTSDSSMRRVDWFKEVTHEVGLDFMHETDENGQHRMPEIMGSGCAMFDADGDGDLDLYLINGSHALSGRNLDPRPRNRLYRQNDDGSFTDATDVSGLGDEGYGFGIAIGDVDNDGDPDVYLSNYGPDRLYRNNGDGTFSDITLDAGVNVDQWSCSAAFFDYDRDGWLDLYITRYVNWEPGQVCTDGSGRPDYCGPGAYEHETDVLLHNNGDGTYTDVSEIAGISKVRKPGLGVVCDDFNGDGWPDVAVANDGEVNFLWLNRHDGTFLDMAVAMGIGYNMHGTAEAGMGIIAEDFDGDSHTDLFMTHLTNQTNTYYRNRGDGKGFDDLTGASGLAASSKSFTGFGTTGLDVDLDGDLDLLVVNGKVQLSERPPEGASNVPPPFDAYAEQNLMYENLGNGIFESVDDHASTFISLYEVSRGLALGDIDRDGDLDVLVSNMQGRARLYRNDAIRKGHWIMVEAIEPATNRVALGAGVTVSAGELTQVRTQRRASSYLSSHDHHVHFGLGSADQIDRLEVRWPDGVREVFEEYAVDRYVTLVRGEGRVQR